MYSEQHNKMEPNVMELENRVTQDNVKNTSVMGGNRRYKSLPGGKVQTTSDKMCSIFVYIMGQLTQSCYEE